jgi:hypothetical protein
MECVQRGWSSAMAGARQEPAVLGVRKEEVPGGIAYGSGSMCGDRRE